MTKEQFLKFKTDYKNAIEVVKLHRKHRKEWWNMGYTSQEEYKTIYEKDMSKAKELIDTVPFQPDYRYYRIINAKNFSTHLAYYCVKHRFNPEEIEMYIKEQIEKLNYYKKISFWYQFSNLKRGVEKIISFYESI